MTRSSTGSPVDAVRSSTRAGTSPCGRRGVALILARDDRRHDARADGEDDRGEKPKQQPDLQTAKMTSMPASVSMPHDGLVST